MTEKELRHLGRKELLEVLLEQTKKTAELQENVKKLEAELENKRIKVSKSGSMAEAILTLNNLFADADKSAEQYLENIKANEAESKRILEDAQKKAEDIIRDAEQTRLKKLDEANQYMGSVKSDIKRFLSEYLEIKINE